MWVSKTEALSIHVHYSKGYRKVLFVRMTTKVAGTGNNTIDTHFVLRTTHIYVSDSHNGNDYFQSTDIPKPQMQQYGLTVTQRANLY